MTNTLRRTHHSVKSVLAAQERLDIRCQCHSAKIVRVELGQGYQESFVRKMSVPTQCTLVVPSIFAIATID